MNRHYLREAPVKENIACIHCNRHTNILFCTEYRGKQCAESPVSHHLLHGQKAMTMKKVKGCRIAWRGLMLTIRLHSY